MTKGMTVKRKRVSLSHFEWENLRHKTIADRLKDGQILCLSCHAWDSFGCVACNGSGFLAMNFRSWIYNILPEYESLWIWGLIGSVGWQHPHAK